MASVNPANIKSAVVDEAITILKDSLPSKSLKIEEPIKNLVIYGGYHAILKDQVYQSDWNKYLRISGNDSLDRAIINTGGKAAINMGIDYFMKDSVQYSKILLEQAIIEAGNKLFTWVTKENPS